MKINLKIAATVGLALLLGGFLFGGCSSDSVAPQDETPALTQDNAASQASMVALAITEVGPQFVNFTPNKNVYSFNFTDYDFVDGQVALDFRNGGADGAPATPSGADYAHLYTVGQGLVITYQDFPTGAMTLTTDFMADITHSPDTATILAGSGGTFVVGIYSGTYTIDGVVVGSTGYPASGTVTFVSGGFTIVVTFDGSNTAVVSAGGTAIGSLNLASGDYTPAT